MPMAATFIQSNLQCIQGKFSQLMDPLGIEPIGVANFTLLSFFEELNIKHCELPLSSLERSF